MNLINTELLSFEAQKILQIGSPGQPAPGDIWMLNWDGQDLGLCLIAYVHKTYVSALPVTLDTSVACISAAVVPAEASPLHVELVVWAPAPNSIGKHLLGRRIGNLCGEADVRAMVNAAAGHDFETRFPLVQKELQDSLAPAVEGIFNTFASFVDHDWVTASAGHGLLDTQTLQQFGISATKLAAILGESAARAARLFYADLVPSADQVNKLIKSCGLKVQDILMPVHELEATVLSQPSYKAPLQELARLRQLSEFDARNLALQNSFSLAARDTTQDEWIKAENKVRDSLDRLMTEQAE